MQIFIARKPCSKKTSNINKKHACKHICMYTLLSVYLFTQTISMMEVRHIRFKLSRTQILRTFLNILHLANETIFCKCSILSIIPEYYFPKLFSIVPTEPNTNSITIKMHVLLILQGGILIFFIYSMLSSFLPPHILQNKEFFKCYCFY